MHVNIVKIYTVCVYLYIPNKYNTVKKTYLDAINLFL